MSRLINPGLGDQLDRLTILALKILHKGAQDHWVRERNALLAQVRSRNHSGTWLEPALELGAVNATLWQVEDRIRAYRVSSQQKNELVPVGDLAEDVCLAAYQIQDLNDRRAALVDAINALVGEDRGGEKG